MSSVFLPAFTPLLHSCPTTIIMCSTFVLLTVGHFVIFNIYPLFLLYWLFSLRPLYAQRRRFPYVASPTAHPAGRVHSISDDNRMSDHYYSLRVFARFQSLLSQFLQPLHDYFLRHHCCDCDVTLEYNAPISASQKLRLTELYLYTPCAETRIIVDTCCGNIQAVHHKITYESKKLTKKR